MSVESWRQGTIKGIELLGGGAFGQVWLAEDLRLRRLVAVKRLHPNHWSDEALVKRFRLEARTLANLRHPHIAEVLELLPEENAFVMERVAGRPLSKAGVLDLDTASEYCYQLASALQYCHLQGILHRDIKPDNVLLQPIDGIKLVDFGLAHHLSSTLHSISSPVKTQPGSIAGTRGYMSPEQARGAPASIESDIFSYGATCFELLTGERGFSDTSTITSDAQVLSHLGMSLQSLPDQIRGAILRCCSANPAPRSTGLNEASATFQKWCAGALRSSTSAPRHPVLRGPPVRNRASILSFDNDNDPAFEQFLLSAISECTERFFAMGLGLALLGGHRHRLLGALRDRVASTPSMQVRVLLAHDRHPGLRARIVEERLVQRGYFDNWPTSFFSFIENALSDGLSTEACSRVAVERVGFLPFVRLIVADSIVMLSPYGPPNVGGWASPWLVFSRDNSPVGWDQFVISYCDAAMECADDANREAVLRAIDQELGFHG